MFLDVALSQTAYGYDVMSELAITNSTSERFHDICRKISSFRHEAAKHVFLEKIEISHNVFNFHLNEYEEIDAYVKRLVGNDERIVNSLSQIRQSDVISYVRNHIVATAN